VTPSNDLDPREDPYNVKRASRIYFLPNLMTAGNLFCGFMSTIQCIQARLAETATDGLYATSTRDDHYRYAVYLILGAAAFDALDGRLARLGGRESLFGAEFDSLADVISFGIAPGLMMFFFILSPTQEFPWFREIGWFVGFVYLLCAAMRLARFNVITNPLLHRVKDPNRDFVGLPVPAAASTVAATMLFLLQLAQANKWLHKSALILPFLMLMIALLMMSRVRYPSGKNLNMQTQTRIRPFIGLLAIAALVVFYKEVGFLVICLSYVLFGLFRHWRRRSAGSKTTPPF
jgi:CDP-diacylglycerol--serine O-phosphatidyltransferase